MNSLQKWLDDFLRGRHGADQLSFTLSLAGLALVFCAPALSNSDAKAALSVAGVVLVAIAAWRALSRDDAARTWENNAFVNFFTGNRGATKRTRPSAEARRAEKERRRKIREKLKTHEMFRCPKCGASCFVPKGKGRVRITCPKCGEKFLGET